MGSIAKTPPREIWPWRRKSWRASPILNISSHLFLAIVIALVTSPSRVAGVSKEIKPSDYKLKQNSLNSTLISNLTSTSSLTHVSLKDLLGKASTKNTAADKVDQDEDGFKEGFRWPDPDDRTNDWAPTGGMSWGGDAYDTEKEQDENGVKDVIVVAWHDMRNQTGEMKPETTMKGMRVSFVVDGAKKGDGVERKYVHALLVEPTWATDKDGKQVPSYKAVEGYFQKIPNPKGGLVWRGRYLFVTDGYKGLKVFDLEKIYAVGDGSGIGRKEDGSGFEADGYGHVILQTMTYTPNFSSKLQMEMSYASLDRRNSSTPSLLIGEYDDKTDTKAEVLIFPFHPTSALLVTSSSTATPSAGWIVDFQRMIGMVWAGDAYYITRPSVGGTTGAPTDIWRWVPMVSGTIYKDALIGGMRNMFWGQGQGEIWFLGTEAGRRALYALDKDVVQSKMRTETGEVPSDKDDGNGTETSGTATKSAGPQDTSSQEENQDNKESNDNGQTSNSKKTAGIAAGVIAAFVVLGLAVYLILTKRQRKRKAAIAAAAAGTNSPKGMGTGEFSHQQYPLQPPQAGVYDAGGGIYSASFMGKSESEIPSYKAELESNPYYAAPRLFPPTLPPSGNTGEFTPEQPLQQQQQHYHNSHPQQGHNVQQEQYELASPISQTSHELPVAPVYYEMPVVKDYGGRDGNGTNLAVPNAHRPPATPPGNGWQ